MPPIGQARQWVDRFGSIHDELSPGAPMRLLHSNARVTGPLEDAWAESVRKGGEHSARRCGDMAVKALATPNPIIEEDPSGDPDMRLYTWVVESPGSAGVLLWINGLFDSSDAGGSEMHRLEGSDLWTLSVRMPASWRASYTISTWDGEGQAPWRAGIDARAALALGRPDDRNLGRVLNSSLVEGPDAPLDRWAAASTSVPVVEETVGGVHFWVYAPPVGVETPLLILFDGQYWNGGLELPRQIDAAIRAGQLPPVHVLMIDSVDTEARWDTVGVPGGQVDTLIDAILPHVRSHFSVSDRGDRTIASGASLGGLACLWALALSRGEVGHAIAQSPSLWRFNVADALSAAEDWVSIQLQAGKYEGEMLQLSHQLAEDLSGDIRDVRVQRVYGGHDWAWWRVHMLNALSEMLSGFYSK